MNSSKFYRAPWGMMLIVISALTTILCLGIPAIEFIKPHNNKDFALFLPVLLLAGGALFIIKGYTLTNDTLIIHRLFWDTQLPLAGLKSADQNMNPLRGAIRTWGNGGLYSFTGYYYSKPLGTFRMYATDLKKLVVIYFAKGAAVISPENPEEFVRSINNIIMPPDGGLL